MPPPRIQAGPAARPRVFHVKRPKAETGPGTPVVRRLPPPPLPTLDAEASDRLNAYLELLLRWNTRINLVAERDPAIIRERHIIDSLQLLPLLPTGSEPIADLGSGGGFPGMVIAICCPRVVHLVESDRRKAAFLTEAAARLGLRQVQVHASRIEQTRLPPLAAVTARALAALPDLLALAVPHLAPGGITILPKGRGWEDELTAARAAWTFTVECFVSRTDPEAALLRLSDIARGPQA